jgi:hypothetical protein
VGGKPLARHHRPAPERHDLVVDLMACVSSPSAIQDAESLPAERGGRGAQLESLQHAFCQAVEHDLGRASGSAPGL